MGEAATLALLREASRAIDEKWPVSCSLFARARWGGSVRMGANAHPRLPHGGMHVPKAIATRPRWETVETLSDLAARWISERVEPRRKPKTVRAYALAMQSLVRLTSDPPIDSLSRDQVVDALCSLRPGSRPAYFSAWSSCLRWAGRPDLASGIERPKTRRREAVLDVEDLRHFVAALGMAASRGWARRTIVDVILFGLLVPMRESEICALRWQDVDAGSQIASLPDSKTGPRRVPLGKLGASVLASRARSCEWIFPSGAWNAKSPHVTGHAVSKATRRILDRYAERTGRAWHPDTCFHTLRHTWASHALAMGVPGENVRQICGWSSAWIQDRYAHMLAEIREDMDEVQGRLVAGLRMQLSIATT